MSGDVFEVRVSRGKSVLFVLGALLFVAMGVWFLVDPTEIANSSRRGLFRDPGMVQLIGAVTALFGIAGAVVWGRQIARTEPVMTIDATGIRWARWSPHVIPWDAITRIEAMAMGRQKFLCLWLADPQAHRSTTLLGRLQGANKGMGFGDIALSVQGTDRSFAELGEAVGRYAG